MVHAVIRLWLLHRIIIYPVSQKKRMSCRVDPSGTWALVWAFVWFRSDVNADAARESSASPRKGELLVDSTCESSEKPTDSESEVTCSWTELAGLSTAKRSQQPIRAVQVCRHECLFLHKSSRLYMQYYPHYLLSPVHPSIHLELTPCWRLTVPICHQLLSDTWKLISSHTR